MEELIRQAFLHVEGLGPHVAEGHYDLIGPNGEIILPRVWETTVEPDWAISMHMWPMPEPPRGPKPPGPPPGHHSREPHGWVHIGHNHHRNMGGSNPGFQLPRPLAPPPPPASWSGGPAPRPPTSGPPAIVNLTRDHRTQKSKVRGWMKRVNKLLSNRDEDGMI